ncbi:hypothetical protein [Marinococcus sp. PL1-022]|uniref:hypothetical protein n=1 Tax=Marinococcus sp. PL1-022 TaxID=3095363 RepID=UPI0029C3CD0C|nr:hypothetical protein [Marinococcus sp. PL1-022]MDX6152819.1 hypothetical protein [Marinococcus sp. PL1-022]
MKWYEGGRVLNRDAFVGLVVFVITIFLLVYWRGIIEAVGLESVDGGTWLQTSGTIIGAFLGALLAGMISLKSVEKQIEYNKKREAKKENQYLGNVSSQLGFYFSEVVKQLREIKEIHDGHQFGIAYSEIKFRFNRLNDLNRTIEKIDLSGLTVNENHSLQHSKLTIVYRLTDIEDLLRRIETPDGFLLIHRLPSGENSYEENHNGIIMQIGMNIKTINDTKKMIDEINKKYSK